MTTHKLVKYSGDWADEMVVRGFTVFSNQRYESWIIAWKKAFETEGRQRHGCGSNQWIDYETFEDFESSLTITDITEEQASTLDALFGDRQFGHFP